MMREPAYEHFTAKEIKPAGWLRQQLEIQAAGLSGNLDAVWPDIRESAWTGGGREGWERLPYWLDGFVPLAYLLDDEALKRKADRYIDAILSRQQPDGWLCPCAAEERARYDVWPFFLICKVLVTYEECTGDGRIEPAVSRALKCLHLHLRHMMFQWAASRWFECLIPIAWLYRRAPDSWLLELADMLRFEGLNYRALFEDWKFRGPRNEWSYYSHVVNLAMALKSEALWSLFSDRADLGFPEKMFSMLEQYHGTAVGHFTGDECLSGDSPIQGTELCGVVEAMFSDEVLFGVLGDKVWLDRLERLAFNALPATISADMWTHQYLQMTNQIACYDMGVKKIFRTDSGESNLFGLEPNFGCCTANFSQGWPKLALHTFYRKGDAVVSAVLAPSVLTTSVKGVPVRIELSTLYPFRKTLKYSVTVSEPVSFPLRVRIPEWAESVRANGKDCETGEFFTAGTEWSGTQEVRVEFGWKPELRERPRGLFALHYGPLVFSLAIAEEKLRKEYVRNGVERKFPYCDYEILPKSPWNYAFAGNSFQVCENDGFDRPFSRENPPLSVTADMAEIDWGLEDGYEKICAEVPRSAVPLSGPEKKLFLPYGCTDLRMTEMPRIRVPV